MIKFHENFVLLLIYDLALSIVDETKLPNKSIIIHVKKTIF